LVGTALVAGSSLGPMLAGLVVAAMGYRGMFVLLAGIGVAATAIVARFIPETMQVRLHASRPGCSEEAIP
jgi:predicted MFS family arabinose efflux permease